MTLAEDLKMLGLAALEMLTGEVPSKKGYTFDEIREKLKYNSNVLDADARSYVKELASRNSKINVDGSTEYLKARDE